VELIGRLEYRPGSQPVVEAQSPAFLVDSLWSTILPECIEANNGFKVPDNFILHLHTPIGKLRVTAVAIVVEGQRPYPKSAILVVRESANMRPHPLRAYGQSALQ